MSPGESPSVAVTGAGYGLGAALLSRLAARDDLGALYAVADVAGRHAGAVWRPATVGDPRLAERFAGVTTVVHLDMSYDLSAPAAERSALNRQGTAGVLEAARVAGVRRVVLTTSAEVYGVRPDNAVPLPDRAPLRGEADETTLTGDHVEMERLAGHAVRAGLAVTVLRPASLVGGRLGPGYDGQLLRLLSAPRLLAVRGVEPLWQVCHVDDLLAALELAATGTVTGQLALGGDGGLPQTRVEALAGRRRLELPAAVALGTAQRLHRAGVTTSSRRELDHVLGPLVVASDGLRAAGWRPMWTNEDALAAHVLSRGADVRVAATATGATVALLGTAALVRRARRRRRR